MLNEWSESKIVFKPNVKPFFFYSFTFIIMNQWSDPWSSHCHWIVLSPFPFFLLEKKPLPNITIPLSPSKAQKITTTTTIEGHDKKGREEHLGSTVWDPCGRDPSAASTDGRCTDSKGLPKDASALCLRVPLATQVLDRFLSFSTECNRDTLFNKEKEQQFQHQYQHQQL